MTWPGSIWAVLQAKGRDPGHGTLQEEGTSV